jgi:hypothetical protein
MLKSKLRERYTTYLPPYDSLIFYDEYDEEDYILEDDSSEAKEP